MSGNSEDAEFLPEKPVDVLGKECIPVTEDRVDVGGKECITVTEDRKEVSLKYDKIPNHQFKIWE